MTVRCYALLVLATWIAGQAPAAGAAPRDRPQRGDGDTRAPEASRKTVEARLRTYELPPSEADLAKLGRGVDDVLVAIAADEKTEVLIKARAISALAYCGTGTARRFLEQTIDKKARSSQPGDRLLLRKAAVSLGWMGGLDTPARLGPLLENPDPEVRLDAALALGLTRLKTSAELLRKRLPVEPDARVRLHIGRQLKSMETQP